MTIVCLAVEALTKNMMMTSKAQHFWRTKYFHFKNVDLIVRDKTSNGTFVQKQHFKALHRASEHLIVKLS